MSLWTGAWLVWLAAFIAVETPAIIRRKRGDTLSEHAWDWFCLRPGDKASWCRTRRLVFISFWGWLTIHFLSGGTWL